MSRLSTWHEEDIEDKRLVNQSTEGQKHILACHLQFETSELSATLPSIHKEMLFVVLICVGIVRVTNSSMSCSVLSPINHCELNNLTAELFG